MEKYAESNFATLVEHDCTTGNVLIDTLQAYFDNNCNIVKTAEKLYLHKNTLRYRMEKIEQLTKRDLKSFNDLYELNVSVK